MGSERFKVWQLDPHDPEGRTFQLGEFHTLEEARNCAVSNLVPIATIFDRQTLEEVMGFRWGWDRIQLNDFVGRCLTTATACISCGKEVLTDRYSWVQDEWLKKAHDGPIPRTAVIFACSYECMQQSPAFRLQAPANNSELPT
jgi:hypothetical protein